MPKVHFHEHVGSYASISKKAPQSLLCLKQLFEIYDSAAPNRTLLDNLLAPGFHDIENGSDRSVSRTEAIDAIIETRAKCIKHQFDLKHAYCLEHSGSHHTVFFESVRFMFLAGSTDWVRLPVAGRLEVKITENKFSLKDAVAVITARHMTTDNSQLLANNPVVSPRTSPIQPDLRELGLIEKASKANIPDVPELPASATILGDEKPPPVYRSAGSVGGDITRSPTVTSGSLTHYSNGM